jgi:hypothetical protein
MNRVITIPQQEVNDKERLLSDYGQTIAFYDDFMLLKRSGKWDILDEESGVRKDVMFANELLLEKSAHFDLDVFYKPLIAKYVVNVHDFLFVFDDGKSARGLFAEIIKWKFGVQI